MDNFVAIRDVQAITFLGITFKKKDFWERLGGTYDCSIVDRAFDRLTHYAGFGVMF